MKRGSLGQETTVHKFVLNLITEWRKLGLPIAENTVVVAVSGGADSLALLLAIDELRTRKKLDLRIAAAHFNHNLRGRESDADEEFVKQIAIERNFELSLGHASIAHEGNLEQNARNARYDFLRETAENLTAGWVLTAHTLNDQAETLLLNLIRGSGIDGLSGIRPVRELSKGSLASGRPSPLHLARPLLRWAKREATESFCRESGVQFRYDTMNEDMSFKRVRVRKMLLPMLKEFNPKIVETLASTAGLMQQAAAGGQERLENSGPTDEELWISDLSSLEASALRETLRAWLRKTRHGGLRSIGLKHIEAIERLVRSKKSGRTVELPGFGVVRKHNGRLSLENIEVD